MKHIPISELRSMFNTIDSELDEHKVIIATRHGKPVVALVECEYLETITETMDVLSDENAVRMLRQSIDDILAGRVIDHDEIEREFNVKN